MLSNIELESYNIQLIGESILGKFGKTYLAKCLISGKKLTIKEISHPSQIEVLAYGGQQAILNFNHPSLPKTERIIWQGSQKALIIREYCNGIDLKEIISDYNIYKTYTQHEIIAIFIQILDALQYLHSQNYIHQDIKPSNIIINRDKNRGIIKATLIDLEQGSLKTLKTTFKSPFALLYSPPEQILTTSIHLNESADIFALGISLFEALTRQKPFQSHDPEFALNLQLTYPLKNDDNLDKELFEILCKATAKGLFNKPPSYLSKKEIETILNIGIKQRYQSAIEMINALKGYLEKPKKDEYWKFWKK